MSSGRRRGGRGMSLNKYSREISPEREGVANGEEEIGRDNAAK